MKTKIIICKLLITCLIGVLIHSCSDDFLTNNDRHFIESCVCVFPDKSAQTYPISLANAGNATYTITKKPDWLKVESMTGQFQNGLAELTCSAIKNESFTGDFVYTATMYIDVNGIGGCFAEVYYVNFGSPLYNGEPKFYIENNDWLANNYLDFGQNHQYYHFPIHNIGGGCLIWKVTECPEWIHVTMCGTALHDTPKEFEISSLELPYGIHDGTIVLSTNDKDQPTYSIAVRCQN